MTLLPITISQAHAKVNGTAYSLELVDLYRLEFILDIFLPLRLTMQFIRQREKKTRNKNSC